MQIDFNSERPIFLQISEGVEDAVLSGAFPEEEQIPSITDFSVMYRINPATANKGINLLVDRGIVYKKRGVGMFVAKGAAEKLRDERREHFFEHYIESLVEEAKRIGLTAEDIKDMIERSFGNEHRV